MIKYKRRLWTIEEMQQVARLYSTHTARQIADMLGKPVSSVWRIARVLNLPLKTVVFNGDLRACIKKLHAQHMTDAEIAAELNIERRYINQLRRVMGLGVHQDRLLASRRQAVQKQLASMGVKNRAELRYQRHRQYARDHGLPEQIRFRAVQVAYCLARYGPSTRLQICQRLGLSWKSSRKNGLCANGAWVKKEQKATYLSELMHEGIVVKLPRFLQTGRRGGNLSVYDLTPAWRERITQHVQQKQSADTTR